MKIAIIHDWLQKKAGAETVLEQILKLYPKADIFTLVDFMPDRSFLEGHKITTSFIQKLPFAHNHFRKYLPLMPLAIERFNLKKYDLIISSSHAVAKGVKIHDHQKHICYIHSPMRYAWDLREQYLEDANLGKGVKGLVVRSLLNYLKRWDFKSSSRVDKFIANSHFIKERVARCYKRSAVVIHPPIDVDYFSPKNKVQKKDYYFVTCRLVSYKKVDLIIHAFNNMPDKKLIIAGSGPDFEMLRAQAKSNIELVGWISRIELRNYMQQAKAFLYAAIEDFGCVMVESLAANTPVIAYKEGGAAEIILDQNSASPCGILYEEQNALSIEKAVKYFEKNSDLFTEDNCIKQANNFTQEKFKQQFKESVENMLEEIKSETA